MIHILRMILKIVLLAIFSLTIGLGCLILSILLWKEYFMDKAGEIQEYIIDNV